MIALITDKGRVILKLLTKGRSNGRIDLITDRDK
jgi:hypothetical protein